MHMNNNSDLVIYEKDTKKMVAVFKDADMNCSLILNKAYSVAIVDSDEKYLTEKADGTLIYKKHRCKIIDMKKWLEERDYDYEL